MSTISFYNIEKGVCFNCDRPEFLFVSSKAFISTTLMCAACWENYHRYEDEDVRTPTVETHPILLSEPTCQACYRPFINDSDKWAETTGVLADRTTRVQVHIMCLANEDSCTECDTRYARTRFRNHQHQRQTDTFPDYLFVNFRSTDGNFMCESCSTAYMDNHGGEGEFFLCPSCDTLRNYDYSRDFEGDTYCATCYDDNVVECYNCEEYIWRYSDHDCGDDEDSLIHSYSYRPSPYFFGKGKYHFGFELEVEARNRSRYEGARLVSDDLGGRVYCKDDGSLNDGFEIVTHPHTLETYHNEFNWQFLEKLKSEGYRSWNTSTCGLHVHVSRSAFGYADPWQYSITESERSKRILSRQAHELRFMKLIYDNQRQVERLAGRSGNSYATFQDKGKLVRKIKYGEQQNGRYSAINTENDNTIEVRVFKGSLRKERVLSAIEFVQACVEYTRDIKVTTKNHALSWLKFTGYISNNIEQYPNLVTIMSESFAGDANSNDN